jgi:hypothetical protein
MTTTTNKGGAVNLLARDAARSMAGAARANHIGGRDDIAARCWAYSVAAMLNAFLR